MSCNSLDLRLFESKSYNIILKMLSDFFPQKAWFSVSAAEMGQYWAY